MTGGAISTCSCLPSPAVLVCHHRRTIPLGYILDAGSERRNGDRGDLPVRDAGRILDPADRLSSSILGVAVTTVEIVDPRAEIVHHSLGAGPPLPEDLNGVVVALCTDDLW